MAYTLTGTLGYKLTPNLLTRLEVRYDDFDDRRAPRTTSSRRAARQRSHRDLYGRSNVAYIFD